ncbi:MAG: PfkB family carbohydrate kinase [Promethearchaeota archaeon]
MSLKKKSKVIILGSLAFDYIMGFEENFCNAVSVNHEKGEYQSTITANSRIKHFGGTAGNIAYNLGLLNIGHIYLVGAVGSDFDSLGYKKHLEQFNNIKLGIEIYKDKFTAACYIVNDIKANQMIIFHGGALDKCKDINLKEKIGDPEEYIYGINSTQSVEAMVCFAEQLFELKIPMIFDPGQVTPLFPKEILFDTIKKSEILIGNKYEINQILQKIEISEDDLIHHLKAIIKTKGEEGSELTYKDERENIFKIDIPICKPEKEIKDTTGAGDGYRAGILCGLILNMTLIDSCRLGAVISSYVIETYGAQTQKYSLQDVIKRFLKSYGYIPQELESIKFN